jgi:hypothetical protein
MKKCDKYFAGCTFGYPLARTWAVLHKPILQESVTDTCQQLEQVAKVFFFPGTWWQSSLWIDYY